MDNTTFYRHSKLTPYSKVKASLLYIWLIPGVPIFTYMVILISGHRRRYLNDDMSSNPTLDLLNYTSDYTLPFLIGLGVLLWLWTWLALSQPLVIKTKSKIAFNTLGFGVTEFSFGSINRIRVYSFQPLGCLLDIKSPIGSNYRAFAFMANIDRQKLQDFVGDDIEVNL